MELAKLTKLPAAVIGFILYNGQALADGLRDPETHYVIGTPQGRFTVGLLKDWSGYCIIFEPDQKVKVDLEAKLKAMDLRRIELVGEKSLRPRESAAKDEQEKIQARAKKAAKEYTDVMADIAELKEKIEAIGKTTRVEVKTADLKDKSLLWSLTLVEASKPKKAANP